MADSICWTCSRAVNPPPYVCSWARDFIPVEGWTAEERIYYATKNDGTRKTGTTYCVVACPLYDRDAMKSGVYFENRILEGSNAEQDSLQ